MKSIDLQSLLLEGYAEDAASLRRFERRYAPFSIPAVAGFVFGFYLIFGREEVRPGAILAGLCLGLLTLVCLHAYRSAPRSLRSGLRMERFVRADGRPGEREFVYVDRASRTFCRRVAMMEG